MLLVLAALVLSQALGFMHGVVHASHAEAPAHDHSAVSSHPHDHHAAEHDAASWIDALFALHEDPTDCRLYDGLGPKDIACAVPAMVFAMAPASGDVRRTQDDFVARRAALFHARGPPLSR